ncbi:hypothetical protein OG21DRAFT_1525778 [Imleria badia]|nr:hypothetical protein OG21DRAFT_1525778 [Imleria badia]
MQHGGSRTKDEDSDADNDRAKEKQNVSGGQEGADEGQTDKAGELSPIIEILQKRWPAWKEAKGNERKAQWKMIIQELRQLPDHRQLNNLEQDKQFKERYGAPPGSAKMFQYYQPTLSELVKGLTVDEVAEA